MRTLGARQRPHIILVVFLIGIFSTAAGWADGGGGPSSGPGGGCRVDLGGHLVTFTAYQPQLAGNAPYCSDIPALGNVAVVFDYEEKTLRNLPVEFEITHKESGTRVLYEPAATRATGTFTRNINFTEAGDYIARITVVDGGKKSEAHVAFGVAEEHGISINTILIIAILLLTGGYFLYQSNPAFRGAIQRLWASLD